MNNLTDAQIVAGLQEGNEQSLELIYDRYYAALCLFAERIIREEEEAKDIAVNSLLMLWKLRANFHKVEHITKFLYITTRNACINYLKQKESRSKQEQKIVPLFPTTEGNILAEITKTEVVRQLYAAIETLPPQCRLIIRMSYVDGFKNHEIAEVLRLSPHTVKNQKLRGIVLLRERLAKMGVFAAWLCIQNEHIKLYNC